MLIIFLNQDFVMEEETPHGVFEDAGLGWFAFLTFLSFRLVFYNQLGKIWLFEK